MSTNVSTEETDAKSALRPEIAGECAVCEMSAVQVRSRLDAKRAVLVDVREADEHARERIKGSKLLPLSQFDVLKIRSWVKPDQVIVLQCKSGKRAADACRLSTALVAQGFEVVTLRGGIEGWKSDGFPVEFDSGVCPLSVMRQVQLTVGSLVVAGSVLGAFVHPAFSMMPLICGLGMTYAGASGTCGLASVLAAMPWNKVRSTAPVAASVR